MDDVTAVTWVLVGLPVVVYVGLGLFLSRWQCDQDEPLARAGAFSDAVSQLLAGGESLPEPPQLSDHATTAVGMWLLRCSTQELDKAVNRKD